MTPNESARLLDVEQRLLRRLNGEESPARSPIDRRHRVLRPRSDHAVRHAEQVLHCLRWLRRLPTA